MSADWVTNTGGAPIELPAAAFLLHEVRALVYLDPSGERIVGVGIASHTDTPPDVLEQVGALVFAQDYLMHPPPDDEDDA